MLPELLSLCQGQTPFVHLCPEAFSFSLVSPRARSGSLPFPPRSPRPRFFSLLEARPEFWFPAFPSRAMPSVGKEFCLEPNPLFFLLAISRLRHPSWLFAVPSLLRVFQRPASASCAFPVTKGGHRRRLFFFLYSLTALRSPQIILGLLFK